MVVAVVTTAERNLMSIRCIAPCLWFDNQAEEAARFYVEVFANSKLGRISRYGEEGYEEHKRLAGSVMTVEFELEGQKFTALNGGPLFTFNEAISFQVMCDTQEEIDRHWQRLSVGGDPRASQCGWLKDRYGVSWQIVPAILADLMADADKAKAGRTMTALLRMKKLDIADLKRAHDGA